MSSIEIKVPKLRLNNIGINKVMSIAAEKCVLDEFSQSRDPYGKPWDPVARGGMPLIDTGIMRNSVRGYHDANGARVAVEIEYASYHQTGTKRIKQRKMLPDAGVSTIWVQEIVRAIEALKELVK